MFLSFEAGLKSVTERKAVKTILVIELKYIKNIKYIKILQNILLKLILI